MRDTQIPENEKSVRLFGLIGYPLEHSFSRRYFTEKFAEKGLEDARYELFPIEDIEEIITLVEQFPHLMGLNVTTPYKEAVIPYLDGLDETAEGVGAVNTIQFRDGEHTGYNTDVSGFQEAIREWMPRNRALILGSGGASKAACYGLRQWSVQTTVVSRSPERGQMTYEELDKQKIKNYDLIVQATPVGQYPNTDRVLPFPFEGLSNRHCVIDMIYNPDKTVFLERAQEQGSRIQNGYRMLVAQAEASWSIWTNK